MSRHHRAQASSGNRRAQFTGQAPGGRKRLPLVAIAGVALLLLGTVIFTIARPSTTAAPAQQAAASQPGGDIALDAATLDDGQARFYRYTSQTGREIRFFVMMSRDGVVRAAFDTCDVCYRERKGYRQAGDAMVCNNCGQSFPSDRINELRGGCNPAPLERNLVGGQVILRAAALEQGNPYF